MAKKTDTKTGFSFQGWNTEHFRRTESYTKAIDKLYRAAVLDISRQAVGLKVNPDKLFSFRDYPTANRELKNIISKLTSQITATIKTGSREEWLFANVKNDAFLESIISTSGLSEETLSRLQDRNLKALDSFQKRKVKGLNLSRRVWKYTSQFKNNIELGIDVSLAEGKSAQKLSQELRQNLLEPEKLFRRVRDKHGNLQLSKAAKAYHPGQGVYRSSYKNAMRLARTEINMAYRNADNLRWEQLDFVVGYEVKLSNNHTLNGQPFYDICDILAGKYPKNFVFNGWHPQCRCFKVPILQDPDEFNKGELDELTAALDGTEYKRFQSRKAINDVPANFKKWVKDNGKKVDGYKSTPYFIKDNFRYGKIRNGLKFATTPSEILKETRAFIPAKTLKEAELWATQNLDVKFVDFKGLDISVANDINRSVFRIKQLMPDIKTNGIGNAQSANREIKKIVHDAFKKSDYYKNFLKDFGEKPAKRALDYFVRSSTSNVGPRTMAWSTGNKKIIIPGNGPTLDFNDFSGVYVNQKYGKNAKSLNDIVKKGAKSGWFTPDADNFGYIMSHEIGHEIDKTIGFRNSEVFKKIFQRETSKGVQSVTKRLSIYGATAGGKASHKPFEMIAEAWAEFVTSPKPRALATEIGEAMLKEYHSKYLINKGTRFDEWKSEILKTIRQ